MKAKNASLSGSITPIDLKKLPFKFLTPNAGGFPSSWDKSAWVNFIACAIAAYRSENPERVPVAQFAEGIKI